MVFNFDKEAYSTGLLLPTKLEKSRQGFQVGPPWLRPLLTAQFFTNCEIHGDNNRNERNLYCLDCRGEALCSACTALHRDHHVVQIRRSSYHDVVRVSELQKVLDLTGVQTYIINSAKVVFLNARPQPRHAKGVTKTCEICDRSLLDTNRYCSLGCKLTGIRRHNDMTFHLQPKNEQHQHQQQQHHQHQHQTKNTNTNTNNTSDIQDDKLIETSNTSQHVELLAPPPPPPPPAEAELMEEDADEHATSDHHDDRHLAPAVPAQARSSITSEDTGSSGGGVHSSKRTRSSRRSTATTSPLRRAERHKRSTTTPAAVTKSITKTRMAAPPAAIEEDSTMVAEDGFVKTPEVVEKEMLSLEVQKSLGTLKLGTRAPTTTSTLSSMEVDESPTSVSSAAARLSSELSPPTPPPTRTAKRRKGTPHRAPFGGLL